MTEVIDNTIASLNDLTNKTINAGVEFRGFAKALTQAADTTTNAGKKWTVFSRLVSGTPIWAMQNKFRAYLAIVAGFEVRSKANSKAMTEQNKKFVDQMKGIKKVNHEYSGLLGTIDLFKGGTKTMEEFNASQAKQKKQTLESVESTFKYQSVLAATNNEQLATIAAMDEMSGRKAELTKKEEKLIKAAKKAYAFDESRIKLARKTAIAEERLLNPKASKKRLKAKAHGAEQNVRRSMAGEQKALATRSGGVTGKLMQRAVKGNLSFKKQSKKVWKKTKKFLNVAERARKRSIKIQMMGQDFAEKVGPVLKMAFKYLIFGIMAFIGFAILAVFLYKAWGEFQSLGIMDTIMAFGTAFFEIISLIVETFMAFTTGGMEEGMEKLMELGWAIADFIWIGLQLVVKVAWGLVMALWKTVFDLIAWTFDGRGLDWFTSFGWKLAAFVLVAWAAKYFLGIALTLMGIYALPLMIAGLVLAGVWALGEYLADKLDPTNFASGGVTKQGLSVVGEKGPELVRLPKGSRVHSNSESKKMASSGGNTINITINARDTSDAELRRIADQIGSMVNNKINRSTSSGTMV